MCQLFDAFVGSTLNYACEVWGNTKSKEIERVHLKFCKSLLKVKSSTNNMAVYGELGRYPLYVNRLYRIIKYWCKIMQTENIIIYTLYNCLLEKINQRNVKNWAYDVKCLLDQYGFTYVWNNPASVDLKTFPHVFKQTVYDNFVQAWYNHVNESSRLSLYRNYKCTFGYELYLTELPVMYRIALSQLRLASNNLRIETGRYETLYKRQDSVQSAIQVTLKMIIILC